MQAGEFHMPISYAKWVIAGEQVNFIHQIQLVNFLCLVNFIMPSEYLTFELVTYLMSGQCLNIELFRGRDR